MYGALATNPVRKGMLTSTHRGLAHKPPPTYLQPYAGYGFVANGVAAEQLRHMNPDAAESGLPEGAKIAVGGGVIAALLLLPFVVGPWAVKQFKPEWSYGKRLVTSLLVSTSIGIVKKAVD